MRPSLRAPICHAGRARSARAGTQGKECRAHPLALGPGYFAAAKFRDDSMLPDAAAAAKLMPSNPMGTLPSLARLL